MGTPRFVPAENINKITAAPFIGAAVFSTYYSFICRGGAVPLPLRSSDNQRCGRVNDPPLRKFFQFFLHKGLWWSVEKLTDIDQYRSINFPLRSFLNVTQFPKAYSYPLSQLLPGDPHFLPQRPDVFSHPIIICHKDHKNHLFGSSISYFTLLVNISSYLML